MSCLESPTALVLRAAGGPNICAAPSEAEPRKRTRVSAATFVASKNALFVEEEVCSPRTLLCDMVLFLAWIAMGQGVEEHATGC
jgi:hypothetical protein